MKRIESRRLKTLLFDADITYAQLAKKLGVSENNITMKINGKRRWWIDECVEIARILGRSNLEEIFPELYNAYIRFD
jgi:transcriptional regulator with XRE-family HTH domain